MAIHNPKSNNDFNFMNSDTMPLDIRVKPEYDNEEIMPLDTPEGPEYDNEEIVLENDTERALKHEYDNDDTMPTGYSGQSPNMTKGNNNLKMPEGNNNSKGIKENNGICVSIPCHSRAQTRESRAKTAFMPQAFRFAESGRSMVEMLGVLAVIGVLSIGGIMGYSYGMDKYRANETINDIMLMSVNLLSGANQDTLNVVSLPDATSMGYPVSFIEDIANDSYGVQIQNVPSRVCKIVGDALKNMAIVYVGSEDYTPNKENDPCDLSDNNTMEFYFETLKCEPACQDDEICLWGECVSNQVEVTPWRGGDINCSKDDDCGPCGTCGRWQQPDACWPQYNATPCSTEIIPDGLCYQGNCLPKGCNNENPCTGKYEYCLPSEPNNEEAFPDGSTGSCVKVDFKPITVNGTEYWVSNSTIGWWAADAACKALGFNGLISKKTLENENLRSVVDYVWTNEITATGKAMVQYWAGFTETDRTKYHVVPAICQ